MQTALQLEIQVTDLLGMIAEHRRLAAELDALHKRLVLARQAVMTDLGPCPTEHAANREWWNKYRQTAAWQIETDWEILADRRSDLTERIVSTPATSLSEATEKLAVTIEHHQQIGDDAWALVAVLNDFRALIG
jgi:hypothetical protein